MADPFTVLGLPTDSDDETIRKRYLALVKQYPPEQNPQKFAEVRQAYEALKDSVERLRYRLFELEKDEDLESIIEEIQCRSPRRRLSLTSLLMAQKKH